MTDTIKDYGYVIENCRNLYIRNLYTYPNSKAVIGFKIMRNAFGLPELTAEEEYELDKEAKEWYEESIKERRRLDDESLEEYYARHPEERPLKVYGDFTDEMLSYAKSLPGLDNVYFMNNKENK